MDMFDVNAIRKDFPMLKEPKYINGHQLIYFDNAATAFKPQCVVDAVVNYYTNLSTNAHRGDYELSYQVSEGYEEARATVARFINAQTKEIVFTSGASMSLNLVAHGYGAKFLQAGDVVLMTEAEHASNILPWFKVQKENGIIVDYIPLDEEGKLTFENFTKVMNDKVKVVCFANITNVMGFIAPVKEMTELAHQYGAVVVIDAAQGITQQKMDVKALDVDFVAFSGHKLCGPTGVGVLYGKYELLEAMDAFTVGGGSNARFDICGNVYLKEPPFKFEAGTPAIEAVLGFKAAIDYLENIGMDNIYQHEVALRRYMVSQLQQLDHVIIYNANAPTGIITFNIRNIFAQDVASYLNTQGICVRAGNHCAKILMNVLGTNETLRASLYLYNTKEEVDRFIEVIKTVTLEKCLGIFFEE
jgi:cysteine desulfurase / selenocysteine lyase